MTIRSYKHAGIKQANFEQRKENREKECSRCHENPCRCDAGEKL